MGDRGSVTIGLMEFVTFFLALAFPLLINGTVLRSENHSAIFTSRRPQNCQYVSNVIYLVRSQRVVTFWYVPIRPR